MSNNQQPEALRLAHLLALDKWPDAAAELRFQHARIAELESEATENARIIGASAETELALRSHIAELEAQLSACIKLLKKTPKINQALYVGNDRQSWGVQAKAVLDAAISALRASDAKPLHKRAAPMVDMMPPATSRDRWMYEQGRLAERDARTPGSVPAATLVVNDAQIKADAHDAERWIGAGKAIFGDEDHVLVPRGLIGAACYAIDKKRDGTKTLVELRRYTTGDLSSATPVALVPVKLLERIQESLGSFVSDQGWSQSDMDTADALDGLLAAAPQPPIKK